MTTFGELKIGERFEIVELDGLDDPPYFYKISETEGFEESRGHGRETVKPDEPVRTWSELVTLHDKPTEIERAALTMLLQRNHDHVGLRYYIHALASDANEARNLDCYIWEAVVATEYDENEDGERVPVKFQPLREICVEFGYVCWEKEWDHDQDAFGAILDHKGRGAYAETREGHWMALCDDAAARLADAIQNYRSAGRPDGDQTHTIMGMGAPLLSVTTSLAAAVAEYHARMLNIYAGENQDLEMALREALPGDLITQTQAAQIANITPQAINNAIRERRLRAYSGQNAVAHRPGDRMVSRADVERVWPPREA
jgi:hypothetical protein